jgi:hypothetical protein
MPSKYKHPDTTKRPLGPGESAFSRDNPGIPITPKTMMAWLDKLSTPPQKKPAMSNDRAKAKERLGLAEIAFKASNPEERYNPKNMGKWLEKISTPPPRKPAMSNDRAKAKERSGLAETAFNSANPGKPINQQTMKEWIKELKNNSNKPNESAKRQSFLGKNEKISGEESTIPSINITM